MFKFLSKLILRIFGWRVTGFNPGEVKKCVVIALHHTSNYDFPLGILTRNALGVSINFVGKKSLFRPPLGWLFQWLGGYPVDRSKRSNLVDAIADIFKQEEEFRLTIAPEGTRSKVEKLKTGFYYIALKAKVPIIMVSFNYRNKEICFSKPWHPTGDIASDLYEHLYPFFKDVKAYHPELAFDLESLKTAEK